MDGWMDGWMDGVWVDGWMGVRVAAWLGRLLALWLVGCIDRCIMHEWMYKKDFCSFITVVTSIIIYPFHFADNNICQNF